MNKFLIELFPYIIVTVVFLMAFAFGKVMNIKTIRMSNIEFVKYLTNLKNFNKKTNGEWETMKELKLYQCEICGIQYKEKTACTKCEKSHLTPCEIVHCKYVPYSNNAKGYPVALEVSFKDGKILTYKR